MVSALQIPALLVPYPYATADHQTANAKSYVECGAAYMVADSEVEGQDFLDKLLRLASSAELRASMKQAAAAFETQSASGRLADLVEEAAGISANIK